MNFLVSAVALGDVKVIEGRMFEDERGFFVETWSRQAFESVGIEADFVQDNQSFSKKCGTLRGLHFQRTPFAQAKLVRVLAGAILDVVVDLRVSSPTRGRWCSMELREQDTKQLFVPRGFAHGFVTLEDNTVVSYKADAPYVPAYDAGVLWNDPDLAISWPIREADLTISAKDRVLPRYRDCKVES